MLVYEILCEGTIRGTDNQHSRKILDSTNNSMRLHDSGVHNVELQLRFCGVGVEYLGRNGKCWDDNGSLATRVKGHVRFKMVAVALVQAFAMRRRYDSNLSLPYFSTRAAIFSANLPKQPQNAFEFLDMPCIKVIS
jgi:hypothetical protein